MSGLAAVVIAITGLSAQGVAPQRPIAERITLSQPDSGSSQSHPITLDAIVSLRELQEVRISPDGQRIAFIVRQAFRDTDDYRYALFVVSARPGTKPLKLVEDAALSLLRWTPDGRWISYLSARGGSVQLWRIDPAGTAPKRVFSHLPARVETAVRWGYAPADTTSAGVLAYEWSPTGRQVAFTVPGLVSAARRAQLAREGVIYDDDRMNFLDLINGSWVKQSTQLWLFNVRARTQRQIWELDDDIDGFAWSPDERQIAVSYAVPPLQHETRVFWNTDIGVLSIDDGTFKPVATGEPAETYPSWSPDGKVLAYLSLTGDTTSSLETVDLLTGRHVRLGRDAISPGVTQVWWRPDGRSLVAEAPDSGGIRRGKSALYEITLDNRRIRQLSQPAGHLSNCSFSTNLAIAACIHQSPTSPPDPVILELSSAVSRKVATLNPQAQRAILGEVEELSWVNRYGAQTNGFLITPTGYVPGQHYPTLVILYGFEGRYLAQAEWITSYPVQAFARDGFAVLLVNYPRPAPWSGNDFAQGSLMEGYSPLASIEEGVRILVARGIADSTRLGILGWSYGCFLAEFAITHSTLFRVASVGAGGDFNPGIYWLLGRRTFRKNYERVLGGPPYGSTLQNWLAFSPAFNADQVDTPVLMEFSAQEALFGLEMSAALRSHDVPVEFVVYPGEGHILTRPQHRYFSMQRNLEWFTFWLQAKQDTSAAKRSQYQRWMNMRASMGANNPTSEGTQ